MFFHCTRKAPHSHYLPLSIKRLVFYPALCIRLHTCCSTTSAHLNALLNGRFAICEPAIQTCSWYLQSRHCKKHFFSGLQGLFIHFFDTQMTHPPVFLLSFLKNIQQKREKMYFVNRLTLWAQFDFRIRR